MGANTYRDLEVWRLCEEIRLRVVAETETGRAAQDFRFRNQIRGAAEDAASSIAEGFVRFHPRVFAQFIGYALGSLAEVRERVRHAHTRGYFTDSTAATLIVLCVRCEKAAKSLRVHLWTVDQSKLPRHKKSIAPSRSKARPQ